MAMVEILYSLASLGGANGQENNDQKFRCSRRWYGGFPSHGGTPSYPFVDRMFNYTPWYLILHPANAVLETDKTMLP